MYTTTSSLEQILHNNIVVVQALTDLSLNIDVQVNIKLKLTKLKSDTGNRNEFELSYRRKT